MADRAAFGVLLRAARLAASMSVEAVAERVYPNMTRDAFREHAITKEMELIYDLEAGSRRYLEDSDVRDIARALGLPRVPDAWTVALGWGPGDIEAALPKHPDRWDAIRDLLGLPR